MDDAASGDVALQIGCAISADSENRRERFLEKKQKASVAEEVCEATVEFAQGSEEAGGTLLRLAQQRAERRREADCAESAWRRNDIVDATSVPPIVLSEQETQLEFYRRVQSAMDGGGKDATTSAMELARVANAVGEGAEPFDFCAEQQQQLAFFKQMQETDGEDALDFLRSAPKLAFQPKLGAYRTAMEMEQVAVPRAACIAPATAATPGAMDDMHEEDDEDAREQREQGVLARVDAAHPREPHARVHNRWPSKHNKQSFVLFGIDVHGQDCYPYSPCKDPECPACRGPVATRLTEAVRGPAWQTDPKVVRPDTVDYVCTHRVLAEPLIHKHYKKEKERVAKEGHTSLDEKHRRHVQLDVECARKLKELAESHPKHCEGLATTVCPTCMENEGTLPDLHWGRSFGFKCCVVRRIPSYRNHLADQYQSPNRTQLYDIRNKGLELLALADIMEKKFLQDPLTDGRAVCHTPRDILRYVWAADELADTKFALLHHEGKKNNPTGDKKRRQHASKPSRKVVNGAAASAVESTIPTIQRARDNPLRTSHKAHNLPENDKDYPLYSFAREERRLGPEKMNRVTGPHLVINHTTGTGPFKSFDDQNVTNNPLDPYANRVAICHASDCLTTEGAHLRANLGVHIDLAKPFLVVERAKAHHLTVDQSASPSYQPNLYGSNYQRKLYDVRRHDLRRMLAACSNAHEVYTILRDDDLNVPLRKDYKGDTKAFVRAALEFVVYSNLCSDVVQGKAVVFKPLCLEDTAVQTALFDALCEGDVHPSRAQDRIVLVPPERVADCMPNFGVSDGARVFDLYADLRKFVDALRTFGNLGVVGPVADAVMTQKRMEGNHTRVPEPDPKQGPQFGSPQLVDNAKIPAMRLLEHMGPDSFEERWKGYRTQERSVYSEKGRLCTTYVYVLDPTQQQGRTWPVDESSGLPMSELDVACKLYNASAMMMACAETRRAKRLANKADVALPNADEVASVDDDMLETCRGEGAHWYNVLLQIRTYRVLDYFMTTPAFSDYHMNAVVKHMTQRTNATVGEAVRTGSPIKPKHWAILKNAITTTLLRAADTHARAYANYVSQRAQRDELSLRTEEYAKAKQSHSSSKKLVFVYTRLKEHAEKTLGRSGGGQQAWRALARTDGAAVGSGLREAVVRSSVDARPIYGGERNRTRLSRKPPSARVLTDADAFGTAPESNPSWEAYYKVAIMKPSTEELEAFASAYESLVRAKRLRKFRFPSYPGATGSDLATLSTIRFVVVLCLDITRLFTGFTCRNDRPTESLWCQTEKFPGHPGFMPRSSSRGAKATFPAITAAYTDFKQVFDAYLGTKQGLSNTLQSSGSSEQVSVGRIALIRSGFAIIRTASVDVHGGTDGTCDESYSRISVWECANRLGGEAVLRYLSAIRIKRLLQLEVQYAYHCLYRKECISETAEQEQWGSTFDASTEDDCVCADRSIVCTLWCTNARDDSTRLCTIADALRELFASGTVSLGCLEAECNRLLEWARQSVPGEKDEDLKNVLKDAGQRTGGDDPPQLIVEMLDEFLHDLKLWNMWRRTVVDAMKHFEEAVLIASDVMSDARSSSASTTGIRPVDIYRRDDRDSRGGLTPSEATEMWIRCRQWVDRHEETINESAARLYENRQGWASSAAFHLFASSADAIRDLIAVLTLVSDDAMYKRLLDRYATLVRREQIHASDTIHNALVRLKEESKPQPDCFVKLYQAEVQPFYWHKLTRVNFGDDLLEAYMLHDEIDESKLDLQRALTEVDDLEPGHMYDWRVDKAFDVTANNTLVDSLAMGDSMIIDDDDVVPRLARVIDTLQTEMHLRCWLSTQLKDSDCIKHGTLRPAIASYSAVCKMLYERHRPGSSTAPSVAELCEFESAPATCVVVERIRDWEAAGCIATLLVEHRLDEDRAKLDDCNFRVACINGRPCVGTTPSIAGERANLRAQPNGAAKQAVFGAFDDDENHSLRSARRHPEDASELLRRMDLHQFELIRDAEERVEERREALPEAIRTMVASSPRPRGNRTSPCPRSASAPRRRTTPGAGSSANQF